VGWSLILIAVGLVLWRLLPVEIVYVMGGLVFVVGILAFIFPPSKESTESAHGRNVASGSEDDVNR
jgi:hypothetical protein